MGGRGLDQEGGGRPDLSPQGKPLHETEKHEQYRGPDANLRIAGGQGEAEDRNAHQGKAPHHGRFPARPVAIGPQDQSPQRPGGKADPEGRQGIEQAMRGLAGGKEGVTDLQGKQAEGQEVIEFQSVADPHGRHLGQGQVTLLDRRRGFMIRGQAGHRDGS
jgi:hypothetical protein